MSTVTSRSCAAVLEISELCSYIIGFLHDSTSDLKSCALVCRALTFFAQSHLFQVINFLIGSYTAPPHLREEAAARLAQIMEETPHLRSLVRTLQTPIDIAILRHVSNIGLPCVNRLILVADRSPHSSNTSALSVAGDLLALPSLNSLSLVVSFQSSASLDLLFARCNPALCILDILHINVTDAEPMRTHSSPRPQIMNLSVSEMMNPAMVAWFFHPQSPLDLTQLCHVELYVENQPVFAFLVSASAPLEELRLSASTVTPALPLSAFPLLKKLWLVGTPTELLTALTTLPAHSNRLQVITLAARCRRFDYDSNAPREVNIDTLAPIDALLAGLHLPELTRLAVSVERNVPGEVAAEGGSVDRVALVRVFAQMYARGMLVVQHDDADVYHRMGQGEGGTSVDSRNLAGGPENRGTRTIHTPSREYGLTSDGIKSIGNTGSSSFKAWLFTGGCGELRIEEGICFGETQCMVSPDWPGKTPCICALLNARDYIAFSSSFLGLSKDRRKAKDSSEADDKQGHRGLLMHNHHSEN
ncbi:hypothetical protein B0H11DRAFT_2362236 [Mycena galericulata]|nr:hypothetical protein B0H11DRAFT_2362236 [Mycena galericulata]